MFPSTIHNNKTPSWFSGQLSLKALSCTTFTWSIKHLGWAWVVFLREPCEARKFDISLSICPQRPRFEREAVFRTNYELAKEQWKADAFNHTSVVDMVVLELYIQRFSHVFSGGDDIGGDDASVENHSDTNLATNLYRIGAKRRIRRRRPRHVECKQKSKRLQLQRYFNDNFIMLLSSFLAFSWYALEDHQTRSKTYIKH